MTPERRACVDYYVNGNPQAGVRHTPNIPASLIEGIEYYVELAVRAAWLQRACAGEPECVPYSIVAVWYRRGDGPRQRLTRDGVVALQVGFAVVFASVSGVLSLAYLRFGGLDLGYDGERVVTVMPDYAMRGLGQVEQESLASSVMARARLYPGVESATFGAAACRAPPKPEIDAVFEGGVNESLGRSGLYRYYDVDPRFFQTLGISIVQGRVFSPSDGPSSTAVGIVSQSGAAVWWPGQDPIGRKLKLGEGGEWITVVGVVEDAATLSALGREFSVTTQGSIRHLPLLYRPIAQSSTPSEGWLTEGAMVGLDGVVLAARVTSETGEPSWRDSGAT